MTPAQIHHVESFSALCTGPGAGRLQAEPPEWAAWTDVEQRAAFARLRRAGIRPVPQPSGMYWTSDMTPAGAPVTAPAPRRDADALRALTGFDRPELERILQRARAEEPEHADDEGAAWAYDRLVFIVGSLLDAPARAAEPGE